jgi:hypothetical protein
VRFTNQGEMWVAEDGTTIRQVNPRGMRLYAVQRPGWRRPVWFDGLGEAKAACR